MYMMTRTFWLALYIYDPYDNLAESYNRLIDILLINFVNKILCSVNNKEKSQHRSNGVCS